ncbi:phosphoribosyl pyrophosphate synthase-associated protein 2-like [Rhopilema esculentum]|uniref:phosphoribosyl pyrophosphate synthase-associated protein 2-like n=1 Tax=Rhopilema esculentum TaxID=499914 RepID=UPI0031D4CE83|eukprot:gene9097-16752_t
MAEGGVLLFSLKGNTEPLAVNVAKRLGISLASLSIGFFKNSETKIEIEASVRGKDVFLLQIVDNNPNDAIMELLITSYALKTSCANRVVGVIPYLPYSKQSKMRNRGAIPAKLIATMLCRSGIDQVITMDLHSKEIQGFFNCPVDNLRASPFLIQYIQDKVPDYRNAVIVAKNPGSAARAQSFAERLRLGLAVIHGDQFEADSEIVDGRHSPPPERTRRISKSMYSEVASELIPPGMHIKTKQPMNLVGDVDGKIAIIVDDIVDDVSPLVMAARLLKERGAYTIYVMATHGLLSSNAPSMVEDSCIDEVIVTNTIPSTEKEAKCTKIKSVDISAILAEAVRRIHNGESMSYLFRDIPLED